MNVIRSPYPLMGIHLLLGLLTIIFFDGTGDSGDSIYHYLYAKHAPQHPELYFHHWAKPLYVLLFSPVAQFGIIGVKILNLALVNLTLLLTYRVAEQLDLKNPWITQILLIFAPLYYILTFSGLTEPLFAFILTAALLSYLQKRYILTLILISFLPFVRSEGLFFIGIFGLWEFIEGRWKNIYWLGLGTVLYSVFGYFVYNDILWTITKIPYSKLSSTYGSGTAFHFIEQLLYVIGIPFYILFWIGFLTMLINYFRKRISFKIIYLLLGSVIAFIVAHSIFWYFGIFNSMGLNRVLLCIIPFMAVIALYGMNGLGNLMYNYKSLFPKIMGTLFISYVVIFPFTKNPAAIHFEEDLGLHISQKTAKKVVEFLALEYPGHKVLVGNTYYCELLSIDCFDSSKKEFISQANVLNAQSNTLIIWDSWFAVVEHGIELEWLQSLPNLEHVYTGEGTSSKGKFSKMVVFMVK